jgi:hypothetical protein
MKFKKVLTIALLVLFTAPVLCAQEQKRHLSAVFAAIMDSLIHNSDLNKGLDKFMLHHVLAFDYELSKIDTLSNEYVFIIQTYDGAEMLRKQVVFTPQLKLVTIRNVLGDFERGTSIGYDEYGRIDALYFGNEENVVLNYGPDRILKTYAEFYKHIELVTMEYYPSCSLRAKVIHGDDGTIIRTYREFGRIESECEYITLFQKDGRRILYNKRGKPIRIEYYHLDRLLKSTRRVKRALKGMTPNSDGSYLRKEGSRYN